MPAANLQLPINGRLEVIHLDNARIRRRLRSPAFFGKAVSSRIAIYNPFWVACLTLADYVEPSTREELTNQFRRLKSPPVTLAGPIMAIHAIRLGSCWPTGMRVEALSLFDCRPGADWLGLEAEPPVVTEHPLHSQPPNTLSLESAEEDSVPIRIHYDWIQCVEHWNQRVMITSRPTVPPSRLNVIEITTASEAIAAQLTEDLQARWVRRIRRNQAIIGFKVTLSSAMDGLRRPPRQIIAPVAPPAAA